MKIAGLDTQKLEKKCLILGLEDVLVPGKVEKKVNGKEVKEILSNLEKLEKAVPDFHFFISSGHSEQNALDLMKKNGLEKWFSKERCFFVTPEYVEEKEDVDKNLYKKYVEKDPLFKDEFIKQKVVEKLIEKYHFSKEQMVLVGHDLWFAAFYTTRFSGIDFALIKSAFSVRHEKESALVKGLVYISRTWSDIRKLLSGGFPKAEYAFLNAHIQSLLQKELLSRETMEKLAEARRKQLEARLNADH